MNNIQNRFRLFIESLLLLILTVLLFLQNAMGIYLTKMIADTQAGSAQKVNVHLLSRGLAISGIQLNNLPLDSTTEVSGSIRELTINGINLYHLYKYKEIFLDVLVFNQPKLIINYKVSENNTGSKKFKIAGIDKVRVQEGELTYLDKQGDSISIQKVNLAYSPVLEDQGKRSTPHFKFSSDSLHFLTADKLYTITVGSMNGNSRSGKIILDSVKVIPSFSEREFSKHIRYQSDRYEFESPEITLLFNQSNWKQDSIYTIQSIVLPSFFMSVFRDKHVPRDPDQKYEMLQHYLEKSSINISIDSMLVTNGNLKYRELTEQNNKAGEIEFSNGKITANNIQLGVPTKEALKISVKSGFMKSGHLRANIEFPYHKYSFHCSGNLKDMPFEEINRISGPSGGVLFAGGELHAMPFDFIAYDSHSEGTLSMNYRNMDFSVKNKPDGDTTNFISKVITAAASLFIKKESKKQDEDIALKGTICQERRHDRFIFNYMWKSILSGLKSAMTETFGEKEESKKTKSPC